MIRRRLLLSAVCAPLLAPHQAFSQAPLPALSGQTLDGKPYDLVQDRGKIVMLFFWSTDCAVCRDKMPELRANYEAWREKAFQLLAVNIDKAADDVDAYHRALNGVVGASQRFPWIWRHAKGHRDNFGAITQTPTTLLLNREGIQVKQYRGRIAPELWDDIAELVLA